MSSRRFESLVLAAGLAVAAAFAALAVAEVLESAHPVAAAPYAFMAAVIAGPLAVVWPLVLRGPAPERGDGPDDGGGGPPDEGGDEPPPPPWWPEFERAFWAHVAARQPAAA